MVAETTSDSFDYLSVVRRRRGLVLGIWLPITLAALVLSFALPSLYRSSAIFRFVRDINDTGESQNSTNAYADHYVASLRDSVLSVERLRGLEPSALPPVAQTGDVVEVSRQLRTGARVTMVTQKVLDPATGLERTINTGFTVAYDDKNPERARKVAAWLSDAFIAVSRQDGVRQSADEAKFFAAEADRMRTKISAIEANLSDFKQKNFDQLPEAVQANLNVKNQADQDLQSTERELRMYQQNRVFLMQQLVQARAQTGDADTLRQLEDEYQRKLAVYDVNHPDMVAMRRQIESLRRGDSAGPGTSLKSQLATQRSILAETKLRYSEDHPDVKRLERSIKTLEARIASGEESDSADAAPRTPAVTQLETQVNANETQINSLQQHIEEIHRKIEGLQGRLASTPEVEREYDALTRDEATAHQQYDQLITKRSQAEVTAAEIAGGTADKFVLFAAPTVPTEPERLQRLSIALVGVISATLLALMAAIGATVIDPTVRGSRDLATLLNVSPVGIIPVIRNAEFLRRHTWRVVTALAGIIVGVPALYFLTEILTR
jgi:polysaccharide biosynthesis transport protein